MTTNNLEGPLRFLAHAFVSPHSDILDAIKTEEAAGFKPVGLLNNVTVHLPALHSSSERPLPETKVGYIGAGVYLTHAARKGTPPTDVVEERVILQMGTSFNVYSGKLMPDKNIPDTVWRGIYHSD